MRDPVLGGVPLTALVEFRTSSSGSRVGVCWSLASFAQGRAEMKKPERAKPDAPAVRKSAVRANYGIRKVPAECQSVPLKEISHPACASL